MALAEMWKIFLYSFITTNTRISLPCSNQVEVMHLNAMTFAEKNNKALTVLQVCHLERSIYDLLVLALCKVI